MPVKNPKEMFVMVLSHARHGTERSAAIYKELSELAQNSEIQQALAARAFVSQQTLEKIDEAFKLIGEKPVNVTGRLQDAFVEDYRRELAEIQSPEARRLFVLCTLVFDVVEQGSPVTIALLEPTSKYQDQSTKYIFCLL